MLKIGDRIRFAPFDKINSNDKEEFYYMGIDKEEYEKYIQGKTDIIINISGYGYYDFKNCLYTFDSGCFERGINIPDKMFEL